MHHLQIFLFWNSKFEDSPFLSQLTKERVIYLKRKLCIVANECSFDTGRISVMRARVIKRVRPILYGAPCNHLLSTPSLTKDLHRFYHGQNFVLLIGIMRQVLRKYHRILRLEKIARRRPRFQQSKVLTIGHLIFFFSQHQA